MIIRTRIAGVTFAMSDIWTVFDLWLFLFRFSLNSSQIDFWWLW